MNSASVPAPGSSGRLSITGRARFSGIDADILLGGSSAPLTVISMTVAPGMGAPAHISHDEDKLFHVTEGRLRFLIGDRHLDAGPGAHIFAAKGDVHGFSALDGSPAKMTLVSTPARHDRFFQALSDLPEPHEPDQVQAVCEAFRQAIVGPLVEV